MPEIPESFPIIKVWVHAATGRAWALSHYDGDNFWSHQPVNYRVTPRKIKRLQAEHDKQIRELVQDREKREAARKAFEEVQARKIITFD